MSTRIIKIVGVLVLLIICVPLSSYLLAFFYNCGIYFGNFMRNLAHFVIFC